MPEIDPIYPKPVIYVSSPAGILAGVSDRIIAAGGSPVVGWLAMGHVSTPAPDAAKAIVAKCDAVFVTTVVQANMGTDIAAAIENDVPVFHDWSEIEDFISGFGHAAETRKNT